jgi:hypothetical protein
MYTLSILGIQEGRRHNDGNDLGYFIEMSIEL